MDKILLLIHAEADGKTATSAFETAGAAKALAGELGAGDLVLGLVGEEVGPAANRLAGCGASRVLGVDGPEFAQPRYASDAAAAEALCRAAEATIVIAPATSRWNRVLPGVAHRLGGAADTHVTGLGADDGGPKVHRWFYRQRMEAVLRREPRPWFILVEPSSLPAWEGESTEVSVEAVAADLGDACRRTSVVGLRQPAVGVQTIRPEADLLFVAGAGWTKKQADGRSHVARAEKLILQFLNRTRGSLGSSKSLVDLSGEGREVISFLTHMNQVGQTGSTPRHAKGLSTCCHGEEPHTVGWRFINERRAIGLDPNCGWARGKADVLYVADAFEVIAKVNALLAARESA